MSGGHTPGPWAVEGDFLVTLDPVENEYERRAISDLRYWHLPNLRDNAQLASVAPEFLALAIRARQKLATYKAVFSGDKELISLLTDWDAAISKSLTPTLEKE